MSQKRRKPFGRVVYPYLFLLPFLALVFVFQFLPALFSIYMAFTDMDGRFQPRFIGLANFGKIIRDINLPEVLSNSLLYLGGGLLIVLFLSVSLAIATQYLVKRNALRVLYRTLWVVLNTLPLLIYVIFIRTLFDQTEYGILNGFLLSAGRIAEPILWLNNWPLAIVIVATGFASSAGGMILLSSAINAIPQDLYLAASIDGAPDSGIVRDIILPVLRWPIMLIAISHTIALTTGFFLIYLLTQGGPVYKTTIFSFYAFQTAFKLQKYGYGSAISLFMVVVVLGLTMLQMRLFKIKDLVQKSRIED
jgi:inositol-phosphate transport system permease protein